MSTTAPAGQFFALADDSGYLTTQNDFLSLYLQTMQAAYPGYNPDTTNPANLPLDYVQATVFSAWAADLSQQCSAGATELFIQFGVQMLGLAYELGAPALAVVTVTATDTAGYTLPAYTQLTLTLDGSQVGFQTVAPLTIAAGSTSGQVTVAALQNGTAFNGASSPAQIVTPVNWASATTLVSVASGGVDQEDDDAYVQRLAQTLQTMGLATATAPAFASRAMNFTPAAGTDQAEVGRATAIDGYSPTGSAFTVNANGSATLTVVTPPATGVTAAPGASITGTDITAGTIVDASTSSTIALSQVASGTGSNLTATVSGTLGNERTVTVCVTDPYGEQLNTDTITALTAYLQGFREANFVVNVISPTYTTIYVAASVVATHGFLAATVQSNVQAALLAYLTPANFNLPQGALTGWQNSQAVYLSRVASVIQGTLGVDHIVNGSLKLGLAASPTGTSDLILPGAFPLPTSTTASIPPSAISVQTS